MSIETTDISNCLPSMNFLINFKDFFTINFLSKLLKCCSFNTHNLSKLKWHQVKKKHTLGQKIVTIFKIKIHFQKYYLINV